MSEQNPSTNNPLAARLEADYARHKEFSGYKSLYEGQRDESIAKLDVDNNEFFERSNNAALHLRKNVAARAIDRVFNAKEYQKIVPFVEYDQLPEQDRRFAKTPVAEAMRAHQNAYQFASLDRMTIGEAKEFVEDNEEIVHDMAVADALKDGVVINLESSTKDADRTVEEEQ